MHRRADFSPDADGRWRAPLVGDFNADGRDDLATFYSGSSTWWVTRGLNDTVKWADFSPDDGAWGLTLAADFSGDGRDDIATFHHNTGTWWVTHAQGSTIKWGDFSPDAGWSTMAAGDFDGNGRSDIATLYGPNATWWVTTAQNATVLWADLAPDRGWSEPLAGDFNGDGRDDLAMLYGDEAPTKWTVATGRSTTVDWVNLPAPGAWGSPVAGDFNADRTDDLAVRRTYTPEEPSGGAQEPETEPGGVAQPPGPSPEPPAPGPATGTQGNGEAPGGCAGGACFTAVTGHRRRCRGAPRTKCTRWSLDEYQGAVLAAWYLLHANQQARSCHLYTAYIEVASQLSPFELPGRLVVLEPGRGPATQLLINLTGRLGGSTGRCDAVRKLIAAARTVAVGRCPCEVRETVRTVNRRWPLPDPRELKVEYKPTWWVDRDKTTWRRILRVRAKRVGFLTIRSLAEGV